MFQKQKTTCCKNCFAAYRKLAQQIIFSPSRLKICPIFVLKERQESHQRWKILEKYNDQER